MAGSNILAVVTVRHLMISALSLRRIVGGLAMLLPAVLMGFGGLQPSLSAYHATPMRDVFVGTLCAIALALAFYAGYDWRDRAAGLVASGSLVLVALVPFNHPTHAALHLAAAVVFFLTLAYMAGFLFTLTDGHDPLTEQKMQRNACYRSAALIIVLCLVLAVFGAPLLWMESVATVAFGAAWLVKGETVFKDLPQPDPEDTVPAA
jgi:hypothetical protein